jgi:hypothetical protein
MDVGNYKSNNNNKKFQMFLDQIYYHYFLFVP